MNLWLDDKRPLPAGFDILTINAHHAVKLLTVGLVDMVSLDHDLGDEEVFGSGYTVAVAIERMATVGHLRRHLTVMLHTANPVGRERMKAAIEAAMKVSDRVVLL